MPTKFCTVKPMVFPVVMYGCTVQPQRKIDAFKLYCWRRILRVPRTARGSNQWTLKEINPEYALEGLMLKLKLHYFGHLTWRADSLEKTRMLEKTEDKRRGWQRMRWLDSITDSMDMDLSKLGHSEGQVRLVCCSPWDHEESDTTWCLNTHIRKLLGYIIWVLFFS